MHLVLYPINLFLTANRFYATKEYIISVPADFIIF